MPNTLHSRLSTLASAFATSVLDAIRGASLADLQAAGPRKNLPASSAATAKPAATRGGRRARSTGRLARRSPGEIADALGQIVALVKDHKEGLRAEQIRSQLGMQSKELPRILNEGLAKRKLKKKGQKRATTYFAA